MVMVMMVMMAMTVMMTVNHGRNHGHTPPALGLEGPRDGSCHSALAAHHLCQNVIVLDIERISGDFRRRVPVADIARRSHQPQRVLGADFEERLRAPATTRTSRSSSSFSASPSVKGHRFFKVEQEIEPSVPDQGDTPALAALHGRA